jgi:Mn-dependent DtxR family transcriptional regulator
MRDESYLLEMYDFIRNKKQTSFKELELEAKLPHKKLRKYAAQLKEENLISVEGENIKLKKDILDEPWYRKLIETIKK